MKKSHGNVDTELVEAALSFRRGMQSVLTANEGIVVIISKDAFERFNDAAIAVDRENQSVNQDPDVVRTPHGAR